MSGWAKTRAAFCGWLSGGGFVVGLQRITTHDEPKKGVLDLFLSVVFVLSAVEIMGERE